MNLLGAVVAVAFYLSAAAGVPRRSSCSCSWRYWLLRSVGLPGCSPLA